MTKESLLLFENVHKVMKADRVCRSRGLFCRVIPVPEYISSECGMCLNVDPEQLDLCSEILKEYNIQYEMHPSSM
jgi:hypothetical protein